MQRNPVFALVGALLALAGGFWLGRATAPEATEGPAIDAARNIGVAIPTAQLPAFSDGEITLDEVRVAHERFIDCVEEGGVGDGFSSSIDDSGSFEVSWDEQPTPAESQLVGACQIDHLDATRQTFVALSR